MKIVIDMDEDTYKDIKSGKIYTSVRDVPQESVAAIANGTPLPKGCGRLIILDEAKAKMYFTKFSFSLQNWISEVDISKATLKVIEADEEVEE